MSPSYGFIGLGIIGLPMAQRLLDCGLSLAVWNRTPEKAAPLLARGTVWTASPRELARWCDVVVTMVSDDAALEDVALGAEGIAAALAPGKVHLDMSTVQPATTLRLADEYASRGAHFVHAPVLGNHLAAAAGQLLIFAGGAAAALEKCQPVFAALGKKTWTWEQPEKATCVKLACNLLLGGMMELLAESVLLVTRAGVDPRALVEIVGMSALAAPMYQRKGQTLVERNFTPSFYLRHMLKDMRCATDAGHLVGAHLPAAAAVRDVYAEAARSGLADADYSSVLTWLEKAGGQEVPRDEG